MKNSARQIESVSTKHSARRVSRRNILIGTLTAISLPFVAPSIAYANTYYNANSGTDSITTSTTLYFTNPHGNFNLRVWVTKTSWNSGSDRYTISFYDNAGRKLFSEGNQGDRTYGVGGNVTKVVIQRANAVASAATTHWQRS
ncbi:hypothetical protein HQQ80_11670 [Microbacteriaceae bacterium VKM Ac-2855]|nr:hypothetical protein [Microbacteriaceae bacterium VKM Ac-2855]